MKRSVVFAIVAAAVLLSAGAAFAWPEGSSCALAERYGGHSDFYNIMCMWDILIGWIT